MESIQEAEWLCSRTAGSREVIWLFGSSLVYNPLYSPDYIILLFHRLFMTHGQAAQDPEVHRVSECVCLRLFKEFKQARNRPKDTRGKTLPIPQSIVMVYSHLKQLLEDSRAVLGQTNLVLVPINTTTVSSWWVFFCAILLYNHNSISRLYL